MHEPKRDGAGERDEGQGAEHARDGERPDRAARQAQIEQATKRPPSVRLPLRQEKPHRCAEEETGPREPDRWLNAVSGDDVHYNARYEREPHHAAAVEETNTESCVRRLRA